MKIALAETPEAILRCYPVMVELRPNYSEEAFAAQVARQMKTDRYQLVFGEDDGAVVAVGGFRTVELLAWGQAIYVDDLVTSSTRRSRGYGGTLLDWLIERARSLGCDHLHMDSGVQRFAAHRFYLTKRMDITAHHFTIKLTD